MKEIHVTKEKKSPDVSIITQHEDAALKVMMQFFADEILPFLGIENKVVSAVPTESIYLELKKQYQDFNFVMEDGTWKHFEFQSTDGGIEDLKRFRSFESVASYTHGVEITTYVLYSGQIKNPETEFTEGINTYRIIPIIMQDMNADQLLNELKEKAARKETITKTDLVKLSLCPLMNGETSIKNRILAAYEITNEASDIAPYERQKIEAVIYIMADKFLDSMSMEEVEAAIKMTRLGQMLYKDGFDDGFDDGFMKGADETKLENAINLLNALDVQTIAECIGLPLETVQKLKDEKNK